MTHSSLQRRSNPRKLPWDMSKVSKLMTNLSAEGISLDDLSEGAKLLRKLSNSLNSLDMAQPPSNHSRDEISENAELSEFTVILQNLRDAAITLNSKWRRLNKPRDKFSGNPKNTCYICRKPLHLKPQSNFNAWICLPCGEFNLSKRHQSANLSGKVALVTGARVKIGFQVALKLLRARADKVIVTTRFPVDALKRFQAEEDYSEWKGRLHIYALDLRFLQHVKGFCEYFQKTYSRLDILIQNAAQTIRRPAIFYKYLLQGEEEYVHQAVEGQEVIKSWNNSLTITNTPNTDFCHKIVKPSSGDCLVPFDSKATSHLSQLLVHPEDFKYYENATLAENHFPLGKMDEDGQQIDFRTQNSWTMRLDQVETSEMVEVSLVNYMAPYTFLQKLTPLMKQGRRVTTPSPDLGWIVLVSAMEGKFMDCYKSRNHPHTNAAKAALNMLVRTCGNEYRAMGLLLSAVDTGWVTEEHPIGYHKEVISPPLDCVDGAARVLDPIFSAIISGDEHYGRFIKDYAPTSW